MLLPQTKEREYRFKLALRMGLPIFFLVLAFVSDSLINNFESLQPSFYFSSILLLTFSIYFLFFLIYNGFDVHITDNVTKTFSREYLYKYLKQEIKKNQYYTLILLSVDNLETINNRYGLINGDKVLFETAKYFGSYLEDKKIINFPMGHIKSGDFIIGYHGKKEDYSTILELLCLKSSEFKVDDIEVVISGAITDTLYSQNIDYLIENLFELQMQNKQKRVSQNVQNISPNELESYVIEAINKKSVSIATQNIYNNTNDSINEYFVKLKTSDGKILHPKSYLKIVNKLGLMAQYDYLILEKSIVHFVQEQKLGFLALNINPTSLRDQNFLANLRELIKTYASINKSLIFIISENDYYPHIERFNSILQSLRKDGIQIALDKFGSLHTSFLYLRDLDVDIIRFDIFYTKNINNQKIVKTLLGLNEIAHFNGLKTWLKVIEDENTLIMAKELNIDLLQGKALAQLQSNNKE